MAGIDTILHRLPVPFAGVQISKGKLIGCSQNHLRAAFNFSGQTVIFRNPEIEQKTGINHATVYRTLKLKNKDRFVSKKGKWRLHKIFEAGLPLEAESRTVEGLTIAK